ncbi:hypothetical protein SADUNF_Sadunf18G0037100 [Salix dunnii]|uniref:MADS-box domain-containing protein n=1 Tax=Salix dunnii TaxID=1413687 RepID=A0A835MDJ0_9ROSI|nr:hypothetical protein SADUNF_Sadunf18G0037100 [Salix dunnii]
MGRRKLKIQRLECVKARQAKYSKRKKGFLKKAKELAILCDVDLAVLMFSPTKKPSLYVGHDKDFSIVLERMSALSFEEREQRRRYTNEIIKKMYPIDDAEVLSSNSIFDREEALKVKHIELLELKEKLAQKRKILRDWTNPDKVNDPRQIKVMEEHLIATLTRVKNKKGAMDLQTQDAQLPRSSI